MLHGVYGLSWGEAVSLVTLIIVIVNYFKSSISKTARESNRQDMEKLNSELVDFKINVNDLSQLLRQVNRDISGISKRVDKLESETDEIHVQIATLKERMENNQNEKHTALSSEVS